MTSRTNFDRRKFNGVRNFCNKLVDSLCILNKIQFFFQNIFIEFHNCMKLTTVIEIIQFNRIKIII